jgi:hypothetical protein
VDEFMNDILVQQAMLSVVELGLTRLSTVARALIQLLDNIMAKVSFLASSKANIID